MAKLFLKSHYASVHIIGCLNTIINVAVSTVEHFILVLPSEMKGSI